MTTPAKLLLGVTLDGGWKVISAIGRPAAATGGNFSEGYIVESPEGKKAFLKALDYSQALREEDPAKALQALTEAFNFERRVLEKCKDRHLVRVNGEPVQYLILELADGDARSQANALKRFNLAWSLRALHHIATGLFQLHGQDIAHQDLKPSNVLAFEGGRVSKIGDLGRAAYKGHIPPHDQFDIAGDPAYAPPELLYNYIDPDWSRRRLGCDAYLLGSMVVFFFVGVGTTALLRQNIHSAHAWGTWQGSFPDVLPYIREAFDRVMQTFKAAVDKPVRDELVVVVRELCEPDPALRGHPRNRAGLGNPYSLERYVARFDLLARRAELGLLRRL
jgi:eukaryotic-like serine/threonine-protein kinase